MTQSLRIAAADNERDTRQFFEEVLPHLGHQVVALAGSGRELVERCRATSPDLIITDIRMPDMDGIEAAVTINREREVPVILVSAHQDPELLSRASDGQVMAYLSKPVKPPDLAAAILLAMTRFELVQAARSEAANLRQALNERKVIERAKGTVMRRLGLDEVESFRRMRKVSSDRNLKLVQISELVLSSDEIFASLEKAFPGEHRGGAHPVQHHARQPHDPGDRGHGHESP
jgi:two-component system, response regulator PdtaR